MNGNMRNYRVLPIAFVAILAVSLLVGCEPVEMEATVTSIAATTLPARSEGFYAGEPFDPTGLVLTVSKSNGTSEHVVWAADTGITMDPDYNEELEAGPRTVTVDYEGASTNFPIDVQTPDDVDAVDLKSGPDDRCYDVGDAFDAMGLTVTVTDGYGGSRDVVWAADNPDFALSPSNGAVFETSDTESVSVYYKGKKTEVTVEVDDIIIAGYQEIGSNDVAGYWKNGIFTMLGDGDTTSRAYCYGVDESGDVYVGGAQHDGAVYTGGYWDPNGDFNALNTIDSNVKSTKSSYVEDMLFHDGILVMGGRVDDYGSSTYHQSLMLWTPTGVYGIVAPENPEEDKYQYFGSLFEGPTGVEACGGYASGDHIPRYFSSLGSGTGSIAAELPCSAVSDTYDGCWDEESDVVYLCGYDMQDSKKTAVLWKGDTWEKVLGNTELGESCAYGVTVVDGEAYVCGYQYDAQAKTNMAGYWKPDANSANGYGFVSLGNADEGHSYAYYIEANGVGDIYCYGYQIIGHIEMAGYWKPDASLASGHAFVKLGNGIEDSRVDKKIQ